MQRAFRQPYRVLEILANKVVRLEEWKEYYC